MGASEQPWRRLATAAAAIRQVWAAEYGLDPSPHPRNLLHRRPGYDPLADTCLVGDNQQPKTRLREPGDGTAGAWQELKLLPALDVVSPCAIPVDDAIAVEEDCLHRLLLYSKCRPFPGLSPSNYFHMGGWR